MSEAWTTISGVVVDDPADTAAPDATRTYCVFVLETTPSLGRDAEAEPFRLAIRCAGGLAAGVLDKVYAGDRLTVYGRLGKDRSGIALYAVTVALDLRSVNEGDDAA